MWHKFNILAHKVNSADCPNILSPPTGGKKKILYVIIFVQKKRRNNYLNQMIYITYQSHEVLNFHYDNLWIPDHFQFPNCCESYKRLDNFSKHSLKNDNFAEKNL